MWSFTSGLIIGQLSVLVVLALLIRFFLFAESPGVKEISTPEKRSVDVQPAIPQSIQTILERVYYNIDTHPSESMDWLTLLVALNINALRQQAVFNDHLLKSLNAIFASDKIPNFIDTIKVTELDLGKDYPLFNNCQVLRSSRSDFSDGLEAQFDIDLKDKITLGIETRLLLNYPKPMVAYLPVKASVCLVNFSGRASISMLTTLSEDPADHQRPSFAITMSFDPDFRMEFEVNSLVGAKSQLMNVPKLGQVVESVIRNQFAEKLVAPNFVKIPLPKLWEKEDKTLASAVALPGEAVVSTATHLSPASMRSPSGQNPAAAHNSGAAPIPVATQNPTSVRKNQ